MKTFTLTQEHITLLHHAYVGWNSDETGSPTICPKRPYGDSDVIMDVFEIIGEVGEYEDGACPSNAQIERYKLLHKETQTALQIVLCTGRFEPGIYQKSFEYDNRSWKRVDTDKH